MYTGFTVKQDGQTVGNVAVMEQAVNAAKTRAKETGRPASAIAHFDDEPDREIVYFPDGTRRKVWKE